MKYFVLLFTLVVSSAHLLAIKITELTDINGNEHLVTEIDLSNKGLIEFPSKILECKNLQSLTLRKNGFVDIPYELIELKKLKYLDLSENQNLSPIDLAVLFDSCEFELEVLKVADCALFYLPNGIAKHKTLTELDISSNYIKVLPYSMQSMTKLEVANFADNDLINISWLSNKWWSLKECDVSGNKLLESEGLLLNLSFNDKLEKLSISHLTMIPPEFKYFSATELIIKNSVIPELPRHKYSSKISHITFEDCVFPNPEQIVETLNNISTPDMVSFRNTSQMQLIPFLELNVDSLDLRDNELTNINLVVKMEKLKWLDVRSNKVSNNSLAFVKENRPDLTIYSSEPVIASVGVSPPFPGMEPKAEIVKISGKSEQVVPIGKTIFSIPKNAFLTNSGEVYEGEVDIAYTEYITPEDLFFSGISMTASANDETFMFSSGGMFNFEARDSEGNALQANKEQPIEAKVLTQNSRLDMQTWRMNDNGVWEDFGANRYTEVFKLDQEKLDSIMEIDYGELIPTQIEYVGHRFVPIIRDGDRFSDFEITFDILRTVGIEGTKKIKVAQNGDVVVYNQAYHSEYLSHQTMVFDGDSSAHYKLFLENINAKCKSTYKNLRKRKSKYTYYTKEGPNYISKLNLFPDYENDNFDLTFYYKDSLVNIPVVFKTRTKNYTSKPKEIANYFNKYQFNYKKYIKEKRRNFFKLKPYLKKSAGMIKSRAIQAEKNRQQMLFLQTAENKMTLNIGSSERTVSLEGFGLWNCDAKARMVSPTTMASEFSSVAGEMISDPVAKVTIIDKSQNGVINFDKDEPKFFDRNSKNIFIIFFAGAGVGICRPWIETMKGNKMELRLLNASDSQTEIRSLISTDS